MSNRREPELSCTENQCPQCRNTVAMYSPGPSEHNITFRICVECRNKNCWTDYWEDRCEQMTPQEAIDTYDENQERARRRFDTEGRE